MTPVPSPHRPGGPTAAPTPTTAERPLEVDHLHTDLLAIGFGLGLVALAASIALARPHESVDDGWMASALAAASVAVLVAADQLAPAAFVAVAAVAGTGAALGRWRAARIWAPGAYVGAGVVLMVVAAALPDTEGPSLLGAALVPVAAGALVRRTWWRGAAAGAGTGALAAAVAAVTLDASAGRSGALVITAIGALACAALVVLVLRALSAPDVPVTNERERPSP